MHRFQKHLEEVAHANDFLITISSYSGRAMYGRECLSITGEPRDCKRALALAITLAHQNHLKDNSNMYDFGEYTEEFLDYSQDSMGRSDIVIYWPEVDYEELDEDGLRK